MLLSEQVRAARSLLGWSQDDLAQHAGIGIATLRRLEGKAGPLGGNAESVWKIQATLEAAGIVFIPEDDKYGPGVRLRKVK